MESETPESGFWPRVGVSHLKETRGPISLKSSLSIQWLRHTISPTVWVPQKQGHPPLFKNFSVHSVVLKLSVPCPDSFCSWRVTFVVYIITAIINITITITMRTRGHVTCVILSSCVGMPSTVSGGSSKSIDVSLVDVGACWASCVSRSLMIVALWVRILTYITTNTLTLCTCHISTWYFNFFVVWVLVTIYLMICTVKQYKLTFCTPVLSKLDDFATFNKV